MPLIKPTDLNGKSKESGNGKGPISLDSLPSSSTLQFKPKFLTKKQRQEQAEEQAKQQEQERRKREEQRRKHDQERIQRQREQEQQARLASSSSSKSDDLSYGRDTSRPTKGGQRPPTGPRAARANMPPPTHPASATATPTPTNGSSSSFSSSSSDPAATLTQAEQDVIRSKYLGTHEKHRKKTRKDLSSDKKNMFGWDSKDDTSEYLNPIFQSITPARGLKIGGTEADQGLTTNGRTTSKALQTFSTPAHWSHKTLEEMKERDWRIFREDFGISARGGHIPRPLRSWKESDIPPPLLEAIEHIGYKDPSPIQRQAIPIGLKERDLIGIAETGSGKTASFVIPMLSYISRLPRMDESNKHLGPYALILAPTRELAQQIQVETSRFTSLLGYNCISIVGGRDMNEQAVEMSRGAEIVIATPGRLKDCIDRHVVVLGQCAYVVMDEADRMVNLGFEDVLNYILDSLPVSNVKPEGEIEDEDKNWDENMGVVGVNGQRYRVTMLYSATMPASVDRMARKYLRRPATITIGDANQAVGTVVQTVEFLSGEDKKKSRLFQILSSGFEPPIIIFSTTRQSVDSISREVSRHGFNCTTLHAGKSQDQREESLQSLRNGSSDILIATDLAGRGIDVPNVSLVINFTMPTMFESYIHRIGRTGRAGKKGHAITFLENTDQEWFYDLKLELQRSPVSTVPRELERHPAAQQRMSRDMIKRKRDDD